MPLPPVGRQGSHCKAVPSPLPASTPAPARLGVPGVCALPWLGFVSEPLSLQATPQDADTLHCWPQGIIPAKALGTCIGSGADPALEQPYTVPPWHPCAKCHRLGVSCGVPKSAQRKPKSQPFPPPFFFFFFFFLFNFPLRVPGAKHLLTQPREQVQQLPGKNLGIPTGWNAVTQS